MKSKLQRSSIIVLIFVVTLTFAPMVFALSRKGEIIKFITDHKTEDGTGFSNSQVNTNETSYEATAYALDILDYYKIVNTKVNTTSIENFFTDELNLMLENNNLTLYNLYYILQTLDILEYQLEGGLYNDTRDYIFALNQSGGGFSFTESSNSSNIISTYLVLKSFEFLNLTLENVTVHEDWIYSCNNSDGGFGATPEASSRLSSTFYALLALETLNRTNSMPNKNDTITYFRSFYSFEGGYIPDQSENVPLLSSTYYCIYGLSILNGNFNNADKTIEWILDHQNTLDGGFSEGDFEAANLKSSMVNTYFGFQSLRILNPSLNVLNEEVGMVQFNWVILLIVLTIIGFAVGIGFYIYQERKI